MNAENALTVQELEIMREALIRNVPNSKELSNKIYRIQARMIKAEVKKARKIRATELEENRIYLLARGII